MKNLIILFVLVLFTSCLKTTDEIVKVEIMFSDGTVKKETIVNRTTMENKPTIFLDGDCVKAKNSKETITIGCDVISFIILD
jgi:hypothetical protein